MYLFDINWGIYTRISPPKNFLKNIDWFQVWLERFIFVISNHLMTRTRAQRAAEEAASKTNGADRQENAVVLPKNLATSTHKIQKSKNVIQINCAPPNPP